MKRLLQLFRSDQRGVVALEFVILAPAAMITLIAAVALYTYLRSTTELDRVTFTIGNLVTQQASLIDDSTDTNTGDLGVYWNLAPMVGSPLDMKANGTVIITDIYDSCTGTCSVPTKSVGWQRSTAGLAGWTRTDGSKIAPNGVLASLPSALPFNVGDSVMVIEVYYHYTPWSALNLLWKNAPSSSTPLYDVMFIHPRYGNPNPLQPG